MNSTLPATDPRPVFVTGGTGYLGARLVPRLLDAGYRVRCLSRDPRKLEARTWYHHPGVEHVAGDAGDDRLATWMEGSGPAFYLIHSMIAAGAGYGEVDRRLAANFAAAAGRAGLSRIIYLGGLGETGPGLSRHLASRREVETELASGPVPLTVLRAAMIIGAGSASFEILRYLVERLPVMITPKWVSTECQPVSVHDALRYLVACLETPATLGRTLDIGGPDVLTYLEIMQRTARSLGLRPRRILPVPVLTPRLSSLWIHLVTPVGHRIARPLAEGLRNRVVCRNDDAVHLMPFSRLTLQESLDAALGHGPEGGTESSWLDAGPVPGDPDWAGGTVYQDRRSTPVEAGVQDLFAAVCLIGGRQGWFEADWLWRFRGALDRLLGGPGLARGRRDPGQVRYGDVLDFWRVVEVIPDHKLDLRAEMKLPGEAMLTFEVRAEPGGGSRLTQTARFKPKGLAGLLYWFSVAPVHRFVFGNMLHGIRRRAERLEAGDR